jgi:hypothetical protein
VAEREALNDQLVGFVAARMNSVQIAEKDHLGTKNTNVCPAPSPPISSLGGNCPPPRPAGTAKMHLNPLVCKKIRPRYIALTGRVRSLAPSPDRKMLAAKSLCGGAFDGLKFPTKKEARQCRILDDSSFYATLAALLPASCKPGVNQPGGSALAFGAATPLSSLSRLATRAFTPVFDGLRSGRRKPRPMQFPHWGAVAGPTLSRR